MRSAVRNTCFAILSSIESDLRETIGDLALTSGSLDILPTDVRENATERYELDDKHAPGVPPENDIDLIGYTDFADLGKMVSMRAAEVTSLCGIEASVLSEKLESMTRARNRVCHSRPLEDEDLTRFLDLADTLLRDFRKLQWKELKNVRVKIEQDPTFVLRLEIPSFWTAAADVTPHNLPMVDFDETGFVGRLTETRDVIKHILAPHPLVTIVGEGGVGKSALALRCLYEILDTKDLRFDAVIWVSLKTRVLTPAGVRDIHDAVTTTLGIVQAATKEVGLTAVTNDLASLVKELRDYMTQSRLLLVIDNLETLTLEDVRPLLGEIPTGSKVLLTSRIGLGELELRYKLDPLDKKQSVALARRHAKSLNLQLLFDCAEERLGKYCQSLFFNPLLIKWFVSSVSNGADPERLLTRSNQSFATALQFCFENLYARLGEAEKQVLQVLFAARRKLSQTELYFLLQDVTQLNQLELELALNVLHGSSMLKRSFADRRKADSGTQYALTDVSSEYLSRFAPPGTKILDKVQAAFKKLRLLADQAQIQGEVYPYDIFVVRATSVDERICAVFLNNALQKARTGRTSEARQLVDRAKDLLQNFAETYRISAIVEGKAKDLYKADEEIRMAIDLNPGSSLARYQYALFLLKEMEDSSNALGQIDAALQIDKDDPTLETARALILTRLGRFQESAEIYERIIADLQNKPRRWRISTLDQAAECYRRWAETDWVSRDPVKQIAHLQRAVDILDLALTSKDFDDRTGIAYSSVIEDGLFAAISIRERQTVLEWLNRIADASHVVNCPAFRRLTVDRITDAFAEDQGTLEEIKALAKSRSVKWCENVSAPPASEESGSVVATHKGQVKTVRREQKYGFITDTNGVDWFYHMTSFRDPKEYNFIEEGSAVEFTIGSNPKGPCAVNITLANRTILRDKVK